LTPADINDLMDRVRGQMLDTLNEISPQARKPTSTDEMKGTSPSSPQSKKERSSSDSSIVINPSRPPTEGNAGSSHLDGPKGSSASVSSSATSSQFGISTTGSEGGGETEEDEGMVLVDRPDKR
jgi:lysophosphatidate acyltransferase